MLGYKVLGGVLLVLLLSQMVSSINKTSSEWAVTAQKTIWETSQIFHRSTIGLSSFNPETGPKLVALSKTTAKVAGVFGVLGAMFSIAMAFTTESGKDSSELVYMKSEFAKLSESVDTIARSLDNTKDLIKNEVQKAAYKTHEQDIHFGFSQLTKCLEKLGNVTCSDVNDCKRRKTVLVESYVAAMNVRKNTDAVFGGTVSDSVFGESLLVLLKRESKCDIPKINRLTNKVVSLVTKGITVSIFYDMLKKVDYNVLDDIVNAEKMLRSLENKRQAIQDSCFKKIDYWIQNDMEDARDLFSSDIQSTNTKVLKKMRYKYPWIEWHVFTCDGEKEPRVGPLDSKRRHMWSSSKKHNVHCVAMPTNNATVEDINAKIKRMKKITQTISLDDNVNDAIKSTETLIKKDNLLEDEIQSFAVLPGNNWILGYYENSSIKHTYLGSSNVSSMNVLLTLPTARNL